MKAVFFLSILFLVFLLVACEQPSVRINDHTFALEFAKTPEEWERGLQHRTFLSSDKGMLFVFPFEKQQLFWMKDTLIPLDMMFISNNGTITALYENVPPCVTEPCSTYAGMGKYVLEVNAGTANAQGIKVGDLVEIRI